MQNHVTLATAQRLKDAGFPQPEFAFGQFWYSLGYQINIYVRAARPNIKNHIFIGETLTTQHHTANEVIFAPTATDILRELGSDYSICSFKISKVQWEVERRMMAGFNVLPFTWVHENPAEAAALAWLSKNEKK